MEKRIFVSSKFKLSIAFLFLAASIFGCKPNENKITPDTEASIRESIQNEGSARLLVGLSSRWYDNQDLSAAQKAKLIHWAQQRLLKALEKRDFMVDSFNVFETIPCMVFRVYDEETLDFLISSYLVNSIEEDIPEPPAYPGARH